AQRPLPAAGPHPGAALRPRPGVERAAGRLTPRGAPGRRGRLARRPAGAPRRPPHVGRRLGAARRPPRGRAPAPPRTGPGGPRPRLTSVPGHWAPQPGEPAPPSLDRLGEAVEQALRQGARLWPVAPAPGPGGHEQPPTYVEFVLPYDLLNHDVAGLRFTLGHGRPLPLGLRYAVHLRSLERMRTDDRLVRRQWQERWRVLRQQGVTVHGWSGDDAQRLDAWQTTLAGESARTAVVLDAPADTPALEALKAAIAEGIALAI